MLLLAPFLTFPFGNTLLRVAQLSSESTDLRLFFKSVSMATTSSVIAVLIAFPVAYYLAFCVEKTKYTWLLIVITPFLTSYLLRIFAWKVVLGDQGLINSGLASLGVISADKPLSFLIYSQFTVMVVLTYAWVPFICLPIFISLENMDRKLLEAATDLGASRMKAFKKITLPLAAPGRRRGVPVRVHPVDRRVHHAVAGGWHEGLHVRAGGRRPLRRRRLRLAGRERLALFLLTGRAVPDGHDLEVPAAGGAPQSAFRPPPQRRPRQARRWRLAVAFSRERPARADGVLRRCS